MNFIGQIESALIQRELKYCERCGGLFLRSSSSETSYCIRCQAHWARLLEVHEVVLRKNNDSRIGSRRALLRNRKRRNLRTSGMRGCGVSEVNAC
jgi:hypothetical protein